MVEVAPGTKLLWLWSSFYNLFVDYRNRQIQNAKLQAEWVAQQNAEKEAIADHNKGEDAQYAAQTNDITRMRGMLEDEMTMKKNQQLKELQAYN